MDIDIDYLVDYISLYLGMLALVDNLKELRKYSQDKNKRK